jgi:hypothetical protein
MKPKLPCSVASVRFAPRKKNAAGSSARVTLSAERSSAVHMVIRSIARGHVDRSLARSMGRAYPGIPRILEDCRENPHHSRPFYSTHITLLPDSSHDATSSTHKMLTPETEILKPLDPSLPHSDDYEIFTLSDAQVTYAGKHGGLASLLSAYSDTPLRVEGRLEAPDRSQLRCRRSHLFSCPIRAAWHSA